MVRIPKVTLETFSTKRLLRILKVVRASTVRPEYYDSSPEEKEERAEQEAFFGDLKSILANREHVDRPIPKDGPGGSWYVRLLRRKKALAARFK